MEEGKKQIDYIGRESETDIWKQYNEGLNFQRQMQFSSDFPKYERFKCGDQWPEPTANTKSLPRPVFNIISMFVSNKKSSVLNNNIKMIYRSNETGDNTDEENPLAVEIRAKAVEGAEKFTNYADAVWHELDQDKLNDDAVEDAATNGTGIFHYFWDSSVSGGEIRPYSGSLRGETIDPLNFFVANPQEEDVQKQEWIIISQRVPVAYVKNIAKTNGVSDEVLQLITPDKDTSAEGYDTATKEQDGSRKITLLTKYYRKDGIVYFSKSTRNVTVQKDQCLTPGYEEGEKLSDNIPEEMTKDTQHVIKRYPIALFRWQGRKKCIFGRGEVEGIIPNQKVINFTIAMMALSTQDTGWPKVIVKPGALQQKITNRPGEVLVDHYTSGDGIKYLNSATFNYGAINLVDKIMDLSRTTSGVTEVSTGETLGANMAASAIIALQNQAKLPIDNIQKRFYRAIKDIGYIWEEFFKTYYDSERLMVINRFDGQQTVSGFTGTAYANIDFSLKVDVGAGSIYSESLGQTTLDKMYDKGDISVDQYIELSPDNVMPFKATLKQMRAIQAQQMQEQQIQQPQEQQMPQGGMPNNEMSNMQ